ncbi:TPA: hypothetical protein PC598_002325 [Morganella morganii]|nr:hypothetical protein [Morganella morganii]
MLMKPERISAYFIRYDLQPVYKDMIVRIITSEKIFFFCYSQFDNTDDFLNQLVPGDDIIAAGHLLNNGGYWLHWAIKDENNELVPENKYDESQDLLKYLAYGSLSMAVSLLMVICGADSIFIGLLFLFSLWINIFFAKELVMLAISPLNESVEIYQRERNIMGKPFSDKKIHKLIKKHEEKIFLFISLFSFERPKKLFSVDNYELINKRAESIGLCVRWLDVDEIQIQSNMNVTSLRVNNVRRTVEIPNNYFLISDGYSDFYCKTHHSYRFGEVLTKIEHPFFVAVNDKVEVISNVDNNQIIGLYNHTDKSAYLFRSNRHIDYSEIATKSILASVMLMFFIIFMPCLIILLYLETGFTGVILSFFMSIPLPAIICFLLFLKRKRYAKRKNPDKLALVENYMQYRLDLNNNKSSINIVYNTGGLSRFNTTASDNKKMRRKLT